MTELEGTLQQIHAIARMSLAVSVSDVQAVTAEIERTDAFLPLTDPTAWMGMQQTLPRHRAVVAGFLAFRGAIERALAEEAEAKGR